MEEKVSVKIARESIWQAIYTFISKFGALIFVILLARFLKPEGFGIYNLAMVITLVFITFTELGINQTTLRYVSDALGKKQKSKAVGYLRYLLKIKTILTIIFSLLLIILSYPLAFFIFKKPEIFPLLLALSVYLIILSYETFFERLFYAINQIKYLLFKEITLQVLKISVASLVFFIIIEKFRTIWIILGLILVNFIALLILLFLLRKLAPFLLKKSSIGIDKKRVLNFLKYLSIAGIFSVLFGYIDTLMLGIFVTPDYIGYYSSALSLVTSLGVIFSVAWVILPVFTQLKESQMKDSFDKVFRYICLLSIPLTFGALIFGRYFIRLFFGYDYLLATIPFMFLTGHIFYVILGGVIISLFSSKEKPKYVTKMILIASLMNIILNLVLISVLVKISFTWAISGAAIATVISVYFYLFALMIRAKKDFGIRFKFSYFIKPLFSSLVMFVVLFLINKVFITDMNLIIGIFEILLGVIIYFAIMALIRGVGKQDILMIKETFDFNNNKKFIVKS